MSDVALAQFIPIFSNNGAKVAFFVLLLLDTKNLLWTQLGMFE